MLVYSIWCLNNLKDDTKSDNLLLKLLISVNQLVPLNKHEFYILFVQELFVYIHLMFK